MDDLTRLVEPLIPALRRYAHGLVREPAAADDLVQDVLERAISRWSQRRGEGDVRVWLFSIMHNLACDGFRRAARRGREVELDQAGAADLAVAPCQEAGLVQRDILKAVAALPVEQRAVLLLVGVEGLSYAEAAAVLRIPLGTVMSRLSRARAALRGGLAGARPQVAPRLKVVS